MYKYMLKIFYVQTSSAGITNKKCPRDALSEDTLKWDHMFRKLNKFDMETHYSL